MFPSHDLGRGSLALDSRGFVLPSRPFYKWYPGDYLNDTQLLSDDEDLLYRRLLDALWIHGAELPDDDAVICRAVRFDRRKFNRCYPLVKRLLSVSNGVVTHQKLRAQSEHVADIIEKRRKAGRASAATHVATHDPHSQSQITEGGSTEPQISADPKSESSSKAVGRAAAKRGTRLDWQCLPDEALAFALNRGMTQSEALNIFDSFSDYWKAQPGQKGVKLDWLATWRNWCRREKNNGTNRASGGAYRESLVERVARKNADADAERDQYY